MANNKIRIRLKSFDHKILAGLQKKIIGAKEIWSTGSRSCTFTN